MLTLAHNIPLDCVQSSTYPYLGPISLFMFHIILAPAHEVPCT